jgi:hypothetical protein
MVDRKYTRRQFGKEVVGGAGRVGVYGAIGGFVGKIAEEIYDLYNVGIKELGNKFAEYDEKIEKSENPIVENTVKPVKKVEGWREKFWSNLFGRSEEDKQEFRKQHGIKTEEDRKRNYENQVEEKAEEGYEEVSRRGFLGNIVNYVFGHPVESGAVVGGSYGALKGVSKGSEHMERARLKDDLFETRREIRGLKEKLENMVDEGSSKLLVILGMSFIFLSVMSSAVNLTGYSVLAFNEIYSFATSGIFLL